MRDQNRGKNHSKRFRCSFPITVYCRTFSGTETVWYIKACGHSMNVNPGLLKARINFFIMENSARRVTYPLCYKTFCSTKSNSWIFTRSMLSSLTQHFMQQKRCSLTGGRTWSTFNRKYVLSIVHPNFSRKFLPQVTKNLALTLLKRSNTLFEWIKGFEIQRC